MRPLAASPRAPRSSGDGLLDVLGRFGATAARFAAWALVGALCGIFWLGYDRWRRRSDWRILGGLFRVMGGLAIATMEAWFIHRYIDPDPELFRLILKLGLWVGLGWAVLWMVNSPPPSASLGDTGSEEAE